MSATQAFRLLDLPTELRLEIYDWFSEITQYHRATDYTIDDGCDRRAVIVTKHIEGAAAILVCRQMYFEATALRRRIYCLNNKPLRIAVEGTLSVPLLETILMYASNYSPLQHDTTSKGLRTKVLLRSHSHLQSLLFSYAQSYTRRVEVAIDCIGDDSLNDAIFASRELSFMASMHDIVLPMKLDITMRPRVMTEDVARVIDNERGLMECPDMRLWKLRRGMNLRKEEWEKLWIKAMRI